MGREARRGRASLEDEEEDFFWCCMMVESWLMVDVVSPRAPVEISTLPQNRSLDERNFPLLVSLI